MSSRRFVNVNQLCNDCEYVTPISFTTTKLQKAPISVIYFVFIIIFLLLVLFIYCAILSYKNNNL
ncbi:hypothetical protein [Mamestra configurata nucleopolyhedrovirus B]|uniref:Uncharacterized protein n=1 Tax=Mamestra configurata nucleopolyhedrovirus B TaxID=204440 RepID=Q8JM92_9ABAC|nr:hypothetical protein McnBVgp060 [Mamestra configurata nucleopolyhedrovirus B]AAM95047.1 hypothetical protein [Mamestra configurata nucleopolyhedrovirus B]